MLDALIQRLNPAAWWLSAALLSAPAYYIAPWFLQSWATDPYFSHGWMVMLWGVGLAIWRLSASEQEQEVTSAGVRRNTLRPVFLTTLEPLMLPTGAFILMLGLSLDIATLKALGWMFSIFGLLHWRLGAKRFGYVAAPLYFTLLSIPWPWSIVQYMALPLQEVSSTMARFILDTLGLPVWQEGVTLDSGRFKLVVEEGCSGMRSFVAVLTVAIYFMGMGWGSITQRWLHPLVVLIIILCGNGIRLVTALGIGHYWSHEWAMIWVEDISPFLLIVFEAALLLTWLDKPAHSFRTKAVPLAGIPCILKELWQDSAVAFTASPPGSLHLGGLALLLVGILSFAIPGEKSSVVLPEWKTPAAWQSIESGVVDASSKEIQDAMQAGAIVRVVRMQSLSNPGDIVDGQMIISLGGPGRDVDDPRFCYRSKGWRMLAEQLHSIDSTTAPQVPVVNEILEELPRMHTTRLDWFAYRVDGRWVHGYMEFRLHQMLARAMRRLDSIAVVHISTPLGQSGHRENEIRMARERLAAIWQTMPLQ